MDANNFDQITNNTGVSAEYTSMSLCDQRFYRVTFSDGREPLDIHEVGWSGWSRRWIISGGSIR